MTISQEDRLLKVTTPLGADVVALRSFSGAEGISRLFRLRLDLLSEDASINFDDIVGQNVTVSVRLADGESFRHFNGIVCRFAQTGDEGRFSAYQAEVVPKLWLLTRTSDCRIFQNLSTPDIIEKVLRDNGVTDFELSLNGSYDVWDYCVQYRETAFNFISRLMEQEGIFYFFKHEDGSHKLVLADAASAYAPCPGQSGAAFERTAGGEHGRDAVTRWRLEHEIRPGKCALTDYNFETPSTSLMVESTSIINQGGNDALGLYDWPGEYEKRPEGDAWVRIRMEEEEAPHAVVSGGSAVRSFVSGFRFDLTEHPRSDQNGAYALTTVRHDASNGDMEAGGSRASEGRYTNTFTCIKSDVVFRPSRSTPRPLAQGTQPALVVGPENEEIYTDKYGRVKVQFYWDRVGERNQDSSCWVRVSQFWAGKQWGSIHIPRIGQEVLVDFLEGDPDRPIIVGRVYNAEQMPPYVLPDNMTQSGLKSRSTKEGTPENFNELRFEDKKGEEQVYFHAEKNFDRVVENNDTLKVGFEKKDKGDQTIEVFNNQGIKIGAGAGEAEDGSREISVWNNETVTIGSGEGQNADGSQTISVYKNRTETVKTGDETVTIEAGSRTHTVKKDETLIVKDGDRTVTVETGNDNHNINQGNREVIIDTGNDTLTISKGNQTVKISLGKSSTEAMQSIELKVGANSIKIDTTGITISGAMVKVEGTATAEMKSPMTTVKGDGMLTLKGGMTMIN